MRHSPPSIFLTPPPSRCNIVPAISYPIQPDLCAARKIILPVCISVWNDRTVAGEDDVRQTRQASVLRGAAKNSMHGRLLVLLAVMACGTSACGFFWQRIAAEKAPDQKKEAVVWELKGFPDSIVRVTLRSPSGEEILVKDPEERIPKLAKIAWTKDSKVFLARVFCGGGDFIFAYDTTDRKRVDPALLPEELQQLRDAPRID